MPEKCKCVIDGDGGQEGDSSQHPTKHPLMTARSRAPSFQSTMKSKTSAKFFSELKFCAVRRSSQKAHQQPKHWESGQAPGMPEQQPQRPHASLGWHQASQGVREGGIKLARVCERSYRPPPPPPQSPAAQPGASCSPCLRAGPCCVPAAPAPGELCPDAQHPGRSRQPGSHQRWGEQP